MRRRIRTLTLASASAILLFALVGPSTVTAQAQSVSDALAQINGVLAEHPATSGPFALSTTADGRLVATVDDSRGTVYSAEIYLEDLESVIVSRGVITLACDTDLGECVKETCEGEFLNFSGCARGADTERRLRAGLVIEYEYDTRAYRKLESSFQALTGTGSTN